MALSIWNLWTYYILYSVETFKTYLTLNYKATVDRLERNIENT